jgi:polyhydroxyalkanoate synthesis regulator phasin
MKKTNTFAALGLAAGLAAGGAAGLVVAIPAVSGAQSTSTTTAESTTTAPTDTTRPDPGTHISAALAPLVADGTLTQEQADKVVSTLKDAMPQGRGGPGGPGGEHAGRGGPGLDAAATALGITADELRTDLQGGQTIAQVAASKGVGVQTVIDAMVAEAKTHLAAEVASGEHTQAEADQKLADLTQRITDSVNNGMPARGDHGPGGRAPADSSTSTTQG